MFTCLGLPMNRYTFVSFRKPKRFPAQMPTSTFNLFCNTVTQGLQVSRTIRFILQRSVDETLKYLDECSVLKK